MANYTVIHWGDPRLESETIHDVEWHDLKDGHHRIRTRAGAVHHIPFHAVRDVVQVTTHDEAPTAH